MREPPVGIIGAFAAERPTLAVSIIFAGMFALAVVGGRQLDPGAAGDILSYVSMALYVLAAPIALIAAQPRRAVARVLFLVLVTLGAVALAAASWKSAAPTLPIPDASITLSAFAVFAFLAILSPLGFNVARLGVAAAPAATLGAGGGAGYLALSSLWGSQQGAVAVALALALGMGVGVSVSANFTNYFTEGANRRRAAAAAGHGAVAISAYSLIVTAAYFIVQTFDSNFGAVDWRIVWAGVTASAAALIAALVTTTAGLAKAPISEQAAVDENYRRVWFSATWRPIRAVLPSTTAGAVSAIALVMVVVAMFEAGFKAPVSISLFLLFVWLAAIVSFVSIRTSVLIVLLVAISAVLADYAYAVLGAAPPALATRLGGLAFCAVAVAHMTVSWRDASEIWRNARDIAEHALNDGLRRYLFLVAGGAAALYVSAISFEWPAGIPMIVYFLTTALISLALAPALMIALSARFSRY